MGKSEEVAFRAGRLMSEFKYEWFLFDYKKGFPDRISRAFKTKAGAEKAREKYPVKERGGIGVGVSQIPVTEPKRKAKLKK